MSWTYDATDLNEDDTTGQKNVIRLVVGDTYTGEQLLQDEEIYYFLTKNGNSTQLASQDSVRAIIAKYARDADTWMGHTRVEKSQRVRQYRQLLEELQSNWSSIVVEIFAGGQSIAGKLDLANDTDAVQPRFNSNTDDIENQSFQDD